MTAGLGKTQQDLKPCGIILLTLLSRSLFRLQTMAHPWKDLQLQGSGPKGHTFFFRVRAWRDAALQSLRWDRDDLIRILRFGQPGKDTATQRREMINTNMIP